MADPSNNPAEAELQDTLRFLGSPAAHPGANGPIEMIETHMSWVVLADDRALKLKKPVRTAWFDFTTLAARERNAREELRLNRRLAPAVYVGLVALCREAGSYVLLPEAEAPTDGRVVDWLVLMRRLPAERMLDRMIASGSVTPADIDRLIEVLARFYRAAPRPDLRGDDYLARFVSEQAINRSVLLQPQFALAEAAALLDAYGAAIAANADTLRARAQQHRLVDCHGDLRPEHVCLLPGPVVIDALEFSAALRQVDPVDELVFLGLECELAGAPWITTQLLSHLAGALDGPVPAALLRFHAAGRALLRARLCAAHLLDPNPRTPQKWLPRTRRYLALAGTALQPPP